MTVARTKKLVGLPQTYSALEQELAILLAVWEMIDSMVNFENFLKFEPGASNLMIESAVHQRLFNILLVDFLSLPTTYKKPAPFGLSLPGAKSRPTDGTYLFYLRQVCANPQLGRNATDLSKTTEDFSAWLEGDAFVEGVWLPPLKKPLALTIDRMTFIKICGNIVKHNFSRLQADAQKIQKVLRDNGRRVKEETIYEILPAFKEWYHDNVLNYHLSTIAEFLNNIRWAIYEYLQPHFRKSFVRQGGDPPRYTFKVPTKLRRSAVRGLYWDLMNKARGEPYFPRFEVHPIMKRRY
ncbi:hypothetical protein [Mesorhizobium sp. LSJC264A00]|uniref:hypothetical protein n=1 Tax=unclassified Mesorhizobium TaxID=325217 RepID=UPI0003CF1ACF|nr:hypothetical protein [Mesorhizobium sp. LSJC264A00]ESX24170.1 hypothetical protein X767_13170 [Mesorhizobium sp. LSJC264A00]